MVGRQKAQKLRIVKIATGEQVGWSMVGGWWWVEWWATSGNLDDKRLRPGGGVDRCPYFPAHVGEKHKQEDKRKIPQQTMAYFG